MRALNTETESIQSHPFPLLDDGNGTAAEKLRRQADIIGRMSRLNSRISPQVADGGFKSEDIDLFPCHRREITALFLDLRGYTAFTDRAEPEEVMALLRRYYSEAGSVIFKFEGTLEYFAGDGMMIFFNDPVPCENHAERAVRTGVEIRDRIKKLRVEWLKNNYDLDIGIGLATGMAALGHFGFRYRISYGAVGKVINLAARLCGEAKGGQILTTDRTLSKVANLVNVEPLEALHLKGFDQSVSAFNIVNLKQQDKPQLPQA
jgi:class 3 adenylate cyclase